MGSKYNEDDMSNGNSKGNDTSLIVNVNDTQSDIDEHEESHYSEPEVKGKSSRKENSSKKSSRNNDSSKKRLVSTSTSNGALSFSIHHHLLTHLISQLSQGKGIQKPIKRCV